MSTSQYHREMDVWVLMSLLGIVAFFGRVLGGQEPSVLGVVLLVAPLAYVLDIHRRHGSRYGGNSET